MALLGVLSVFAFGVRAQHTGGRTTEAINYCRELMEAIRVRNFAFQSWPSLPTAASGVNAAAATDRVALDAFPFNGGDIAIPANTNFTRNIQMTKLATSGYQANVVVITVKVYWVDRGKEREVALQAFARNQ